MMNKPVPSAKDVLPRGVLSQLQSHCSGLVYIPPPQTKAQMNAARIRSLHTRGYEPGQIAQSVGLSTRHVSRILEQSETGSTPDSSTEYKVYETVPREVVELVQRYVRGPLYVPPRTSQATRRMASIRRLLRKGTPINEIAERVGVSERRVWQVRKAELESAQLKPVVTKPQVKIAKPVTQDPFATVHIEEAEETPPVLCRSCGSPMDQRGRICIVCELSAKRQARKDKDIIVVSNFPHAFLDREF